MITRERFVEKANLNGLSGVIFNNKVVCYTDAIRESIEKYLHIKDIPYRTDRIYNIGMLVIPNGIRLLLRYNDNFIDKIDAINDYLQLTCNLTDEKKLDILKQARHDFYTKLEKLDAEIHNILSYKYSWKCDPNLRLTAAAKNRIFNSTNCIYNFDYSTDINEPYEMITCKKPLCYVYPDGDVELTEDGRSIGESFLTED